MEYQTYFVSFSTDSGIDDVSDRLSKLAEEISSSKSKIKKRVITTNSLADDLTAYMLNLPNTIVIRVDLFDLKDYQSKLMKTDLSFKVPYLSKSLFKGSTKLVMSEGALSRSVHLHKYVTNNFNSFEDVNLISSEKEDEVEVFVVPIIISSEFNF